ncbi:MAG: Fic family protein [Hyphomicrobium sp.]|jgi:hypothetical protein
MAPAHEKLAASLAALKGLQDDGRRVFRSGELGRLHRERLLKSGFLHEIIKGWLMSASPDTREGDSTPWYASFWEFCARYADSRFGPAWHLSPAQSLVLHAQNTAIPGQVVLYSPKGTGNPTPLPFQTSLYDLKTPSLPLAAELNIVDGLRLYTPAAALVKVPEAFFVRMPIEAQVALSTIKDASALLTPLLAGGHSVVAGRLAGALRRTGRPDMAAEIMTVMKRAGYTMRETDPFDPDQPLSNLSAVSPVVARIKALWSSYRDPVLALAPPAPGLPHDKAAYLKSVDDIYKNDAYHSLSIEGYSVTLELIERVRSGQWNPEQNEADRKNRDALAARGYWQAFQSVKATVADILNGAVPGALVKHATRTWYSELFQPSVTAGVIPATSLAGFRSIPVYLRGSRHVPPRWESIPDAITALFDLLKDEPSPFVRAVIGHWMMGYIHPYPDGNGRTARFLMNAMLASGGYNWLVIRVEDRAEYLATLEAASVGGDIVPFARFIADRLSSVVPA